MANYTDNYQFTKPTYAEIADVQTFNNNMTKIDEILHASQVSLAPAYDPTKTFNAGDVVMYELLMYECQEDGVTGVWDPTKWARTTAGEHGGGSDVEPNPTGEPTATLNKLGIEGTIYGIEGSGGGNVYGAFIDTNRVIQAETSVGSSDTYTATQDCMVVILLPIGNHNTYVYIDGVKVINMSGMANIYYDYTTIPLKEGQVMTFDFGSTNGYITVYGLTFGTQNIFTPQIYSTEEREVGVWIDNKPLYQKTVEFGDLPNNTLKSVAHNISNLDFIVSAEMMAKSSGGYIPIPFTHRTTIGNQVQLGFDATNVNVFTASNQTQYTNSYVTIRYTKTTDTAGSGLYNTLGVPMVHYSTEEQVIGTWMDGKTLYQKTFDLTTMPLNDNTWNNRILGTTGIKIKHYDGLFSLGQIEPSIKYEYYRSSSQYFSAQLTDDTSDINVRPNMNAGTLYAGIVTIQYTKTTD